MAKLTMQNTIQEVLDLAVQHGACIEADEWFQKIADDNPGISFQDGWQIYIDTPNNEATQAWAAWLWVITRSYLSDQVKAFILTKIRSSVTAFHLYKNTTDLDPLEKQELLSRIDIDRLPTIKKEILEGKVTLSTIQKEELSING